MKLAELFEDSNQVKWVIGTLGSNGLILKSQGLTIKLDKKHSDALAAALEAKDEVVVKSSDNKQYRFTPSDEGFDVNSIDDEVATVGLSNEDVAQITSLINPSNTQNEI